VAVGPNKDTLTIEEFGDALGYFFARLADLTHTPSFEYSPYLGGGRWPPPAEKSQGLPPR
jgi:hypothetical protein